MSDERPDPDELLARVQAAEAKASRGKLKIFFGAAPGVGKTYAMLEAGRKLAKSGVDVVVGYLEPHTRPDTLALALGLDVLPKREVEYGGRVRTDFSLQLALERHPQLILVDEMAHTNLPDPNVVVHEKRWRDIEELLDAGIDVYTTLNVQHLESVNDVVATVTGVVVRETVPDSIFDKADEVELVDLPPDDLIERLQEGKVYVPGQAQQAVRHFFRKGNLIALRELALRQTAERVNAQMLDYRHEHAVLTTWPTAERLLVCIGPSPFAARLIRATRRMAAALHAPWIAVHVDAALAPSLSQMDRDRLAQNMHLAEQLGGETVTLAGNRFVDEIVRYARDRNVTKIIVGKPQLPRWREILRGSYVYELTRACGDIDIYVISGDVESAPSRLNATPAPSPPLPWSAYAWSIAVVLLGTGISWFLYPFLSPLNLIMIYLVGVVIVSARLGRGPSILASILSVVAFDFLFIPPFFTFAVDDTEYLLTFVIMLFTGLVISTLTDRVRRQAEFAYQRARRTSALYGMSRELASMSTLGEMISAAVRHVGDAFSAEVTLHLPDPQGRLHLWGAGEKQSVAPHDLGVVQWVYEHGERAGLGTDTLPGARTLYLPIQAVNRRIGVIGIQPAQAGRRLDTDQLRFLEAFADQLAIAIERVHLTNEVETALLQAESERMRNSLLSAVSHDLRTPLTAIAGASSTLIEASDALSKETRLELAETIFEEAERLNRLVGNLLEMTRLDAGAIVVHKEWQPLEEVLGVALQRLHRQLVGREVHSELAPDLPPVPLDGVLMEQVFVNLLENAAVHTPPGTPIELSATCGGEWIQVNVADRGPGLPTGEERRIFDKFHQIERSQGRGGVGLGLAICKGIVEIHGGRIWAENRPGGGVVFSFTLPLATATVPAPWAGVRPGKLDDEEQISANDG
ncbi:MAG: sensor histidine kinase KdpD [Planctomycetota bacterium]